MYIEPSSIDRVLILDCPFNNNLTGSLTALTRQCEDLEARLNCMLEHKTAIYSCLTGGTSDK